MGIPLVSLVSLCPGPWVKPELIGPPEILVDLQTIRSVMELSSDAEKLSLLVDIRNLLSSLQPGAYPRRELAWLLTTAWNRGCHHAKYRRLQEAQQFMEAALSLVDFCPDYQARQEVHTLYLVHDSFLSDRSFHCYCKLLLPGDKAHLQTSCMSRLPDLYPLLDSPDPKPSQLWTSCS